MQTKRSVSQVVDYEGILSFAYVSLELTILGSVVSRMTIFFIFVLWKKFCLVLCLYKT